MSLSEEYQLDYLKNQGFIRKKCGECGAHFWTLDEDREVCGDPPCEEYSFIKNPPIQEEFDLTEMREQFLNFFEERRHERLHRYPVIARWRGDIFLTIASIADFQPHVTSGEVEPPANPLTISQPCIRLDDIDSVGKSGRHLISFEMMAHHAFNSEENHVYWKDKTVELCQELLTELGVPEEEIVYKENPWAGGGNAGPAFEVLVRGLELATLVFMNMEESESGEYEVKGKTYKKMDRQIVDTGYGLERFVWASKGSETIYDAIFGDIVSQLRQMANLGKKIEDSNYEELLIEHAKLAGYMDVDTKSNLHELREKVAQKMDISVEELKQKMEPLEEIYALADHTRTISFMLGDGIVPSNVKAGYLARLVIRRAIRLMNSLDINESLFDVVSLHLEDLRDDYPRFKEKEDTIENILDLEEQKYQKTLEKGHRLVKEKAREYKEKDAPLPQNVVMDLYDTHGIPPETTQEVAQTFGVETQIPDDFYSKVAKRHESPEEKEEEKPPEEIKGLPKTDLLFYSQPEDFNFESVVLEKFNKKIVLDQTLFYPEGGGQPADRGKLVTDDGVHDVIDVQSYQGVVIHELESAEDVSKGDVVEGRIEEERRNEHKRHHTATHLILGASERVLGNHVWQTGSELSEEKARLDITHYENISEEELKEIEWKANQLVMDNKEVKKQWVNRNKAQEKHGFELYQGGAPRGKKIRVVEVNNWNVQACGGTHVSKTGEIGPIKVLGTESIQDGVIRINFTTGKSAVNSMHQREELLNETSEIFSVSISELPRTAQRFFNEWKERGKQIEQLKEELASLKKNQLEDQKKEIDGFSVISELIEESDMSDLRAMQEEIKKEETIAFLANEEGEFIVSTGKKAIEDNINARELVQELTKKYDGGGGGSKKTAQGKLNKKEIKNAVNNFEDLIHL
ncbi:alanine--tRNA ligase [archaeon SCG-AAA382B04]|nr:alanine--tRNA ligase [archaeon SCG-AAA382B04]